MPDSTSATGSVHLYENPVPNDREGWTLGEDETYFYEALPMMFNWRLVMTPKADLGRYDYGWCYDGVTALVLALRQWDPDTQNEPLGWKKRPSTGLFGPRVAPSADQEPEYNRSRCIHGDYIAEGCSKDKFCAG